MKVETLTVAPTDEDGELAPRPFLFRVLDCQRLQAPSWRHRLDGIDEVVLGRGDESVARVERTLRLVVPDPYVSTTHAALRLAEGRWRIDDSSKNGTFVNGARVERALLEDGDVIELGGTFYVFRDDVESGGDEPDVPSDRLQPLAQGLVSVLPELHRTFRQLERIARSPIAVVLRGETGTGKEVVARAIHAMSARPGAFVAVNCGAVPDALIEGELFGYRKGAFSGAVEDRPGLVRSADRGTLLLDEVGDLPLHSQAAFLRVLQEREVLPIGATAPTRVNLRVVSASHLDLRALVVEKKFRADLEARLAGIEIEVPPLRERREDLGVLVAAIVGRVLPDREVILDKASGRALLLYDWPKNIRGFEQVLTAAAVLAGRLPIGLQHLPPAFRNLPAPKSTTPDPDVDPELRRTLARQLEGHLGNVSAVARTMGKPRKQVQRWLKRFSLDPEQFRR